jgi:hypothetical protein
VRRAALQIKTAAHTSTSWIITWRFKPEILLAQRVHVLLGHVLPDRTEYSNLIYFRDPKSLFVNLYLPSKLEWKGPLASVKVVQTTGFPEADGS